MPHMALQFPRHPPMKRSMFGSQTNPVKEKFMQDSASLNHKLYGFQHIFQQHAAGLFTLGASVIPPGHPLYNEKRSVEILKIENDKLQKENNELKKMIKNHEKESTSHGMLF